MFPQNFVYFVVGKHFKIFKLFYTAPVLLDLHQNRFFFMGQSTIIVFLVLLRGALFHPQRGMTRCPKPILNVEAN
jgi:hypothetical protein